jgi:hypothetical protein
MGDSLRATGCRRSLCADSSTTQVPRDDSLWRFIPKCPLTSQLLATTILLSIFASDSCPAVIHMLIHAVIHPDSLRVLIRLTARGVGPPAPGPGAQSYQRGRCAKVNNYSHIDKIIFFAWRVLGGRGCLGCSSYGTASSAKSLPRIVRNWGERTMVSMAAPRR